MQRAELPDLGVCFETHWSPLRAEDGRLAGTIAVAVDVSERSRNQRAREEAGRAVETLFNDFLRQSFEMLMPPGYTSINSMKKGSLSAAVRRIFRSWYLRQRRIATSSTMSCSMRPCGESSAVSSR